MPTVMPSHLPAPRPSDEIAGVIRAKMSTGTKNPRNPLNSELKVTNTRASQSGKKKLQTMPSRIATMILNSSELSMREEFMEPRSIGVGGRAVRGARWRRLRRRRRGCRAAAPGRGIRT